MFRLSAGAKLHAFKGVFEFVGMEAEGAGRALVNEASIAINEEETIGPSGVSLFGDVIETVDHCGELDSEFAHTAIGKVHAIVKAARAGKDDVVLNIALHLPNVAWVSFQYVHRIERDFVSVLLV